MQLFYYLKKGFWNLYIFCCKLFFCSGNEFYIFFKGLVYLFLERRERREKVRERNIDHLLLAHSQGGGPGQQPRHVSWLGIKLATFGSAGWHSVPWATPARAAFYIFNGSIISYGPILRYRLLTWFSGCHFGKAVFCTSHLASLKHTTFNHLSSGSLNTHTRALRKWIKNNSVVISLFFTWYLLGIYEHRAFSWCSVLCRNLKSILNSSEQSRNNEAKLTPSGQGPRHAVRIRVPCATLSERLCLPPRIAKPRGACIAFLALFQIIDPFGNLVKGVDPP